ncbi:MAG: hypothetical protein VX768_10865 [Planctomycetota bacterium]|nr:hypothetical protein [Planctomycetota bacterium]
MGRGKMVCIWCGYHLGLGRQLEMESPSPGSSSAPDEGVTFGGLEMGDLIPNGVAKAFSFSHWH